MVKKEEKNIQVSSWHELIEVIENMNPYKFTIVLTGFINQLYEDKVYIKTLIFSIKPIDILKNGKDEEKRTENGS